MATIVHSFFHDVTRTWSHIVTDPATRTAAIIDPVLDFEPASGRISSEAAEQLLAHIHEHGLRVEWILETHTHADHLSAASWLKRSLRNVGATPQIAICADVVEVQRHFGEVFSLGVEFAADGSQFDRLLNDGERFRIGDLDGSVIATPGHTVDSISYLIGDAVFVGDTLFAPEAGTGRCDFPGGSAATQYRSIGRLYDLHDTTRVFLCHDYPAAGVQAQAQTTIAAEKTDNAQRKACTHESEYVTLRTQRDATLPAPRFLYPSLLLNIQAGVLPAPDENGAVFIRLPASVRQQE